MLSLFALCTLCYVHMQQTWSPNLKTIISSFSRNLVQGRTGKTEKLKGEEKELAPEERILIEEAVKVKDDGHKIIG